MRVLVTGSEGSLMQATIPFLAAAGHEVVGVDNFSRYGRIERSRAYEFHEADLTKPDVVERLVQGAEGVIQGAATIYGVGGFHRFPATILGNDLALHANVLRAAVRHGVTRVAYISSSMVYERATTVPTREEDAEAFGVPLTDYGLSKLVGERMSRAFQREHGLAFVVWRPFNIITPHEEAGREPGVSHVFADFVDAICVRGENPLPIIGDGEQVRCFTWIGDVAEAIGRFSFADIAANETFNLGNPEPITMRELARRIFAVAKRHGLVPTGADLAFRHLPAFADDVRRRIPDVSKAERTLGFHPTVNVDEALERCVQYVAETRRGPLLRRAAGPV